MPTPASANKGGGLERPIQLEWAPDVFFGVIDVDFNGLNAKPNTSVIWRVTRQR